MNKSLKIIGILIIIIVTLTSYFVFTNYKDNLIKELPIRYLVIKSNSMYPSFKVNDIIIINKKSQYEIGDIITYDHNKQYLITHRIVKICDEGFITKGDYNNCEDESIVKFENVKGKVILIINKKAQVSLFIIVTIVILIGYIKIRKGKENE